MQFVLSRDLVHLIPQGYVDQLDNKVCMSTPSTQTRLIKPIQLPVSADQYLVRVVDCTPVDYQVKVRCFSRMIDLSVSMRGDKKTLQLKAN